MAIERVDVALEDRWNVEALYSQEQEWNNDFRRVCPEKEGERWPQLAKFKGRLGSGASQLAECLREVSEIDRKLSKLYTYAHLKHDEDIAATTYKDAYEKIIGYLHAFRLETSWIEPEIQEIADATMISFLEDPLLKDFRISLERIRRLRPHTLPEREERLLALSGRALGAAPKAFGALNNADLKFGSVVDSQGDSHELTHGTYNLFMRSRDRTLRENSYKALHSTFASFENTLCELISGQMQSQVFEARARNYESCLKAALFPHEIDTEVYHQLIESVRRGLPVLHKYMALRKKLLGYDELHMYDLHVPLVQEVDIKMDFAEAVELVINSVAPLGKKYQEDLANGLLKDRWVDRYENARKRSGAYSSGCYDSMPYVLMNYHGTFNDAMTLAHECGHSMHSLLSRRNQPYQYAQYPIFVAEVASTFNEELMIEHLLEKLSDPMQKAFIINQQIEDIRSTFFRQTMFAEFELQLHSWAEQDVPFTPELLKKTYHKLNQDYFGDNVIVDQETSCEWSRIPHFYYNFYVYQYATGISAASALIEELHKNGEEAREHYLQFLSSGCLRGPLDLLKTAGVDMRKPHAVEATIERFAHLVNQLETLLVTQEKSPGDMAASIRK